MEEEDKKTEEMKKDMSEQNVESDGWIVDIFKLLLNFYNRKDVTKKDF